MCGHDYLYLHMCAAYDAINCSAFARMWEKLMQIVQVTGVDWRERRLFSKLYVDQRVKRIMDMGETRRVKIGGGARKRYSLSLILFNFYRKYLTKEALEVLEDSKIGGQVICAVKYRVIHKSGRDFRPVRYSSRDGHAKGEHVNRGRDTPSFCPTLQVLDMSTLGDAAYVNPANSKTKDAFLFPVHAIVSHDCPVAVKPASMPRRLFF